MNRLLEAAKREAQEAIRQLESGKALDAIGALAGASAYIESYFAENPGDIEAMFGEAQEA